jgi:hypothetical protein
MDDAQTQAFLQNVSILNLNVSLTAAAPVQPGLLRSNLGSAASPTALGGNQAPEADLYAEDEYQCFFQILGFQAGGGKYKPCGGPKGSPKDVIILPWGYTFPPDVSVTVNITALLTTPNNGGAWEADHYYAAGSVVQCPGEDQCIVALGTQGHLPGVLAGMSGPSEPKWPGANVIADGMTLTWSPLIVTYRVDDAKHTHAPDGKAVYQAGEYVVWNVGQQQSESIIETWQSNHSYVANQSVVICPPDVSAAPLDHESVCVAKTSGVSGGVMPHSWNHPETQDNQLSWIYDGGPIVPGSPRWTANKSYLVGDRIRCEQQSQKQNMCSASISGTTGSVEPYWAQSSATGVSAAAGAGTATATQRDNQVLWTPYTPSATTAAPASDQVAQIGSETLPQVHGPSLWGLSTALVYSTHRVPNSYSFTQTVAAGCPTPVSGSTTDATMPCPTVATSYQRATDVALMISPYVFHHLLSKLGNGPDGIDAESKWSFAHPADYIPEPILGFGLNSPGNSYYAGLSMELFVRDLQLVGGWEWIKAPFLTTPISAAGSPGNTVTPNTYSGWAHVYFIGLAYNLSGLVTGH